jgi:hypothetical protein
MRSVLGASYIEEKLVQLHTPSMSRRCPDLVTNFATVNVSVLLLGDSTDNAALEIFCRLAGATFHAGPPTVEAYPDPAQQLAYCRTKGGGLMARDQHIGLTGPPYWMAKRPSPTRENVTLDALPQQAALVRSLLGGTMPTVVVAHSMAWDYSAWWQHVGDFSRNRSAEWMQASLVERWASRVDGYLCALRRTFPTSLVVWRTAPYPWKAYYAGDFWAVPPAGMYAMNQAARQVCAERGVPVVDMASTFAEWETGDGHHPHSSYERPKSGEKYAETRDERLQHEALWQQLLSVARLSACSKRTAGAMGRAKCIHERGGHGGHTALHARPLRLHAPRPGYCGKWRGDVPTRGCKQYLRGVKTIRECATRCTECARCQYASFSRILDDCSLYERCDLGQLARGHGFVSVEAAAFLHEAPVP